MLSLLDKLPFFQKEPRPLPAVVPTDEVIPVHLFDDSAAARGIVLVWTFKFDDVLDPQKLHESLSELFQMDGWRRFSGRFRYRPDGGLEIHVPRACTEDRPAVQFTREEHAGSVAEHPLASKLPHATGKMALYPGPKEFCPLGLGPETPRNIDDFVFFSKPQFCLHVQGFSDATLVSITHSHVSTDLMGWAAILEAWSQVMAGQRASVKPLVGYREDVFEGLWNPPLKKRHVLSDKVLEGWRFKYWGMRSLYESWRGADVQSRTLCIPSDIMAKIMRQARNHIGIDATSSKDKPFISEGDVLTAVACRMLAQYQGIDSNRELTTIMAIDPRSRVKSVFDPERVYVQNSPTNIYFFCHPREALETPLGRLALMVRNAISIQATEEQLKVATSLSVESMKKNKMPIIFGDKDMAAQFMSNWSKGKLSEKMDFTPAVVQDASSRPPRSKRGHPVYYQASDPSHNSVSVISSVFVVMEKDYNDDTWCSISIPGRMWSDLTSYLEAFAKEDLN